ncbi:ABC transporter permease [Kitasatospora viridis]|uniref:FtsX-like permease family protein n=1 Tax=Kitasatospora viridis TaxID=281105 RepID=A0A561TU01_9ACTN|nr:FtsX-like permease family protein [Kitasatospora viridis]TWF90554.1 FtsX-like permease family protein [Kitasatospora viridis]
MTDRQDSAPLLPAAVRWFTGLALGLRMALTGGRDARLRTVLTAIGVGLGVATLLLAASFPSVRAHRDDRLREQSGAMMAGVRIDPSPRTLLMSGVDTEYHGTRVVGRVVRAEGPAAPVPPGLTGYPAPGAMAVSPALARLLDSPDGRVLRDRLPGPITGTIGESGLIGPGDLMFYLGSDQLTADSSDAVRLDHFADPLPPKPTDPVLVLLTVAGVVILLCPVGVFLAAAVRFGGEARDRRLAALRLTGADRATTARIAAGEALGGAVLGIALGVGFFLIGRQLIERVTVSGLSVFAVDVQPQPALAALALLAVPVLAVLVTLLTMRRIAAEPLGVVRGTRTAPRRVWWRIALPALGTALLVSERDKLAGVYGTQGLAVLVAGLLLLLVGTTLLLPPLLDLAGRALGRLGGGPPAWQLALGRLRFSPETATRPVTGIVVTVAGAIALQTLLGALANQRSDDLAGFTDRSVLSVRFQDASGDQAQQYADRLRAGGEVADVIGYTSFGTEAVDDQNRYVSVTVADCATLRTFAPLPDCAAGDVFTVPGTGAAVTGHTLAVYGGPVTWQLPAARAVITGPVSLPGDHPGRSPVTTVLATPQALPAALLHDQQAQLQLHPAPGLPDAEERIRTAVTLLDLHNVLYRPSDPMQDQGFLGIRRALTAGTAAVLTLIGAGMLVGLLEQLRDRRRTLAVLTAFGTRRRTLAWSLLWQSVIPVLVGLALALAAGLALAAALLGLARLPVGFAWRDIGVLTGTGAAAVLAVTLLGLLPLWRRTGAAGLQHE